MWWNILPSWFLTGGLVCMPIVVTCVSAKIYMGSYTGREVLGYENIYKIFRDKRITGRDPFRQHKQLGLDGIPDS